MNSHRFRRFIYILLLSFVFLNSNGQEQSRISRNFEKVSFSEFISYLESHTDLVFFYNKEDLISKTVQMNCMDETPDECLDKACRASLLEYYKTGSRVFIYRGDPVSLTLQYRKEDVEQTEVVSVQQKDAQELKQKAYRIYNIGTPGKSTSKRALLSGRILNFDSGDPVSNVSIIVAGTSKGVSTSNKGFYNIELPVGNHTLQFSSIGMEPTQRIVNIYSDGQLDVEMKTKVNLIGDVDIFGDNKSEVSSVLSGVERFEGKMLESLPALLGEPDVIKSTLMLPGVATVGEGTVGFNVRGGKTDQNLILIDEAPLFYPSHFFGNFSAINSDIVDNAILYKGSIPSNFGGRISSVYEINTIDGSNERVSGVGGLSVYSARLMLEGPVADESSFVFSSRGTYSDWLLNMIKVPELYNSKVGFYDVQGKMSLKLNDKNRLRLGGYGSKDHFQLKSDTLYVYRNQLSSVALEHTYNQNWNSALSFSYSSFTYNVSSERVPSQSFFMDHDVAYYGLKNYNQYKNHDDLKAYFGFETTWYTINPGNRKSFPQSRITEYKSLNENAMEYGLFTGIEFQLSPRLNLETGIRWSGFLSFDDGLRYVYEKDLPLDEDNVTDTITGNRNQVKKIYNHPEYRVSGSYYLDRTSSLKFSYNKTVQYIHMLTNTTAISPTDTWKLSDEYLPPQIGHQWSAGLFRKIRQDLVEASVEGFYKRIQNIKEYKPGASLVLNDHIETEILNGLGKAYGVEVSLKKQGNRLNGWIGYTWSRTLIKSNSRFPQEVINRGEYFPASYDKPHNLNVFANMKASRRVIFSSTINYSTGRPITYPVAKYRLGNKTILHYSKFNQYRIPDYFRIDCSVTLKGSLKANKLFNSSTTFSVYNITGRRNAYSVFFRGENTQLEGYKLSIFGTAIPTITYNFNF